MWLPTLPHWRTCLWLAPTLALGVLAAGSLCGWLKASCGLRTGDTRKIFHFCVFTAAAVLSGALGFEAVNLLGGIAGLYVLAVLALGDGRPLYEALARESDAPRRSLHIVVPFAATAAGGITSIWLFGPWATVGIAVSGCADAVAEPVGIRWGRHRYRVPGFSGVRATRSLEGSAAVLAAAFAAAVVVLFLRPDGVARDLPRILFVAAAVAVVGALVEAASHHGLDNFTVQIAASAVAWLLLR